MKRIIVVSLALLLVAFFISYTACYLLATSAKKQELKNLPNPDEVAQACRQMAISLGKEENVLVVKDSQGRYFESSTGTYIDIPLAITQLNPNYMVVDPEKVRIEFHGGHDHFGLILGPYIEGGLPTGTWALHYYAEGGEDALLAVVRPMPEH